MKYFVAVMYLLIAISIRDIYGWDQDSGYIQIEKISDIGIFDEKGEIVEEFTPNGALKITLQKGKKYYVKIKLINNGEGISMGYQSNTFLGKIRFVLAYESGPIKKNQSVVFAEYDKQQIKPLEIKEYQIPISLDMFKKLSINNTYTIHIAYWDNEFVKRLRNSKVKTKNNIIDAWRQITTHKAIYDNTSAIKKEPSFYWYKKTGFSYYIFLSEEGIKEKYKYYDKNTDKFTYPQGSDK